jgi:hypothetical protein
VSEQELIDQIERVRRVADEAGKRIGLDVFGTFVQKPDTYVFGVKGEYGPEARTEMLDAEIGKNMSEEDLTNYVIWAINKNTLRNRHGR